MNENTALLQKDRYQLTDEASLQTSSVRWMLFRHCLAVCILEIVRKGLQRVAVSHLSLIHI